MNVIRKFATILKGSARKSAEVFIDANQIRIFEQEIIDMEQGLAVAREQLTLVMAERLKLVRDGKNLQQQIEAREEQATRALLDKELSLAADLAADIVDKEAALAEYQASVAQLQGREKNLLSRVEGAARQIKNYRRELSVARAIENSQRAARKVCGSALELDDNFHGLKNTFARIKKNQSIVDDRLDAAAELDRTLGGGLEDGLARADDKARQQRVAAVLERIKQSAASPGNPALR